MMYFWFLAAAIVTVIAAVRLSTYADVIGERTSLGGMIVGTVLLAGATSLPEVTTNITAIVVDNPDIAVSNVLGSNLFNLFVLAAFDVYYRKRRILAYVDKEIVISSFLGIGFTVIVLVAVFSPFSFHFMNVGIEMFVLVVLYMIGLRRMAQAPETPMPANVPEKSYHTGAISLKRAKVGFIIATLIILASGSVLTLAGDAIAVATGISSSFVGTFLIAGATSLPEVVTVLVAIQLANYNLAVGNILGSNLINMMILVLTDILYRPAPVLTIVHPVTTLTIIALLLVSVVIACGLLLAQSKNISRKIYFLPSSILILIYLASIYTIYTLS